MWTHERTEAASSSPADPRNSMCKKSVMLCGIYVVLTNGHSHAILEYILHDAMTSRIVFDTRALHIRTLYAAPFVTACVRRSNVYELVATCSFSPREFES